MKNYSDQIKSPKWQMKRNEILNLRGYKCEVCGNTELQLHVHHRFYIKGREIHEYDNDVLQVLCENCHSEIHSKNQKDNDIIILNNLLNTIDEENKQYLINIIEELININKDYFNEFILRIDYILGTNNQRIFQNYCMDAYYQSVLLNKISHLEHGIEVLLKNDSINKIIEANIKNEILF